MSAVRTLRMGKNRDFLEEVLVDGGSVGVQSLMSADKEQLPALFAHTPLEKAAALGAEALSGGGMTAFERACDNGVNAYLREAKLVSYGPEAVLASGGGRGRDPGGAYDSDGQACRRKAAGDPGKAA